MRITSKDERPHVVVDSNKIAGAFVDHEYSPNGQYVALTLSAENQNSYKIMIIEVRTGRAHGDCLQVFNCKKIVWSGDSEGFFIFVNICAIPSFLSKAFFLSN